MVESRLLFAKVQSQINLSVQLAHNIPLQPEGVYLLCLIGISQTQYLE